LLVDERSRLQSETDTLDMFAGGELSTETVQRQGIEALEAIARVDSGALDDRAFRLLFRLRAGIDAELRPRLLELVGRFGSAADAETITTRVHPTLEDLAESPESPLQLPAIEAAGRLIGEGVTSYEPLLDMLESCATDGGTPVAAAAVRGAGLALTRASGPEDRVVALLEREVEDTEESLQQAAAVGACHALAGDREAREIAFDALEALLTSEQPEVRAHVPRAVESTVSADQTGDFPYKRYILQYSLYDESPAVREATVQAAWSTLSREVDGSEAIQSACRSVVETALSDLDGDPHNAALEIFRQTPDVITSDVIDREPVLRITRRYVGSSDPEQRERTLEVLSGLNDRMEAGSAVSDRPEPISEGDSGEDNEEALSSHSSDADDERWDTIRSQGEALAQQLGVAPDAIDRQYRNASSPTERATAVATIACWFESGWPDQATAMQLWSMLKMPWQEGNAVVRRAVLLATRQAFEEEYLRWEAVRPLLTEAIVDENEVATEAVEAVGRGLQEGNVSWSEVGEFLTEARVEGAEPVATEAVTAVMAGLQEGNVSWSEVGEFLQEGRVEGAEPVAGLAVTAAEAGVRNTATSVDQYIPFATGAVRDDRTPVATAAVELVKTIGVGSGISWREAIPPLHGAVIRDDELAQATLTALISADYTTELPNTYRLFSLFDTVLNPQSTEPFDRWRLLTLRMPKIVYQNRDISLLDQVLTTAIDDPAPGVRETSIGMAAAGLSMKTTNVLELARLCEVATTDPDYGVRREAMSVAAAGLAAEGTDRDRLETLLVSRADDRRPDSDGDVHPEVRATALRKLADAYAREMLPFDAEALERIADAASSSAPAVRRAVVEAASHLVTSELELPEDDFQRLYSVITETARTSGEVRKDAVQELQAVFTKTQRDQQLVEGRSAIRQGLAELEMDAESRLRLVAALTDIDPAS
jgi:hypothetical protein